MQLSEDYIVGLVDGEGSFTAFVRNLKDSTERVRRTRIEPRFYIKLIEKDKDVLYALRDYFGCGSVYYQKDVRKNHQNCYRYEVFNRRELKEIIIPFFTAHQLKLLSKQKDFKIFCDLMRRIEKNEHLTTDGLQRIYKLKQQMH
ncbi:MAG: hypothetical protein A3I31_03185 [Candidatus Colwellbacteria bacterium RIFCSPLOWO2_02_FULL_44_20b]|uniref:Homing endonuclease LAGLIDADG domain-containing protein n=1 Tax=Candidatus Colwellbacteria bacterium RIFCSPLOWO2_02_FULL_44_20b TaxID=1797691 RepID=A0A1G1Z502_9BACT|nr:MAG: hypothetical protein A3I31_03185 [Candidatus Colwellbacteria bacterium RIFCSPLOWO2_02_FULL_44_20b]